MENEEITNEPLSIIVADDLTFCAIYDRDHNPLDQATWMQFKSLEKRKKKLLRLQKQAKLRSYGTTPTWKFGYQMPRSDDHEHASSIDKNNVNNKWAEAIKL